MNARAGWVGTAVDAVSAAAPASIPRRPALNARSDVGIIIPLRSAPRSTRPDVDAAPSGVHPRDPGSQSPLSSRACVRSIELQSRCSCATASNRRRPRAMPLPLGEPCVASLRRAMGTRRRRCDDAPAWAARDVNDAGAGYACGVTIAIRVMRPVDATEVPRDLRDDWRIRYLTVRNASTHEICRQNGARTPRPLGFDGTSHS